MFARRHIEDRLGAYFVSQMLDRPHVTIGGVSYSKNDLVTKVKIGNFAAAKRLENALEEIGARNVKDVDPHALAQVRGVGETTIFVLLGIQDEQHAQELALDSTWRTYKNNNKNGNGKKGRKKR